MINRFLALALLLTVSTAAGSSKSICRAPNGTIIACKPVHHDSKPSLSNSATTGGLPTSASANLNTNPKESAVSYASLSPETYLLYGGTPHGRQVAYAPPQARDCVTDYRTCRLPSAQPQGVPCSCAERDGSLSAGLTQ